MKSSSPRRVRSVFARGIRPAAIGRPVPVAAAPGDAFRDAQAGVFERLSGFFDAVVQAAIGTDAAGRVAFDGNGLRASVGPGGERSTAAIDSREIVACRSWADEARRGGRQRPSTPRGIVAFDPAEDGSTAIERFDNLF